MNAPHLTPIASALSLALFYDTETTGLPLWSEPSEDERQPHIVQLAACLVDLTSRKIISTLDVVIKPNGWTIPDDMAAIHGITTDLALAVGVPEEHALDMFMAMHGVAAERIGHNESFDARIIRIGLKRHTDPLDPDLPVPASDAWKGAPARCTQKMATPIMKLPATEAMKKTNFKNSSKSANLSEAYEFFTGQQLVGAHSAIADVRATIDVFFGVMDHQRAMQTPIVDAEYAEV